MNANDLPRLRSLLTSGDDDLAEGAVNQLASLGRQSLPLLTEMLSTADADARWWATRALSEINDPRVVPLLLERLNDADESVRHCALVALRLQPAPEAVGHLVKLLGNRDRLLAHLAADALIAIEKAAVPALVDSARNQSQAARLEAMRALARIGDPASIPILFAAYEEQSALMEFWADEGLERMGVGMVFYKP
ncbi:MAG: HEAT repeat domain-containing protein [Anaerolineales bacterium]|nr:HEAT repeat domain-containing protein [Anaerolineales bacterium]